MSAPLRSADERVPFRPSAWLALSSPISATAQSAAAFCSRAAGIHSPGPSKYATKATIGAQLQTFKTAQQYSFGGESRFAY